MSKNCPRYLDGVLYNEPTENQKQYFAGKLVLFTDEESINEFCKQIKQMAQMYRQIDEKYLMISISRNDGKGKKEFSFQRDDWSKDGAKAEKVKRWMDGDEQPAPSESPSGMKTDPDESFGDDDLPF